MLIKKSQAILKHFIDLKFSLRFTLHGGAPNGSVPQISFLQVIFCLLGDLGKLICPWMESVGGK